MQLYPSKAGWLGLWSGIGSASTISHGMWLIFSLPIWAITGTATSLSAALNNDIDVPLEKLDLLAQFARFPAGMPRPRDPARPAAAPATQPAPTAPPPPETEQLAPDEPGEPDEPGMIREI
jgi:hypothetical protein